jgi:tetratricopeptide (TPR) repeat protein
LASVYHEEEEYEKAIPYYRQVLKLDPDNVYASNNLAEVYLNAPPPLQKAETALAFAEDALRILPSFGPPYYYKGEALNRLGRHDEAHKTLTGAIERGFASKDNTYWMMYELAIADSRMKELVTQERLSMMLALAENDGHASQLLSAMSSELERFRPEDTQTIAQFVRAHEEHVTRT